MAGRFFRKRKRSNSTSSEDGEVKESTPTPSTYMDFYSDKDMTPSPPPKMEKNEPRPEESSGSAAPTNYRYVYDLCFYKFTKIPTFMKIQTFRKVHLSVCRYMNGCLKHLDFSLDYFVNDNIRRYIRKVIFEIKVLVNALGCDGVKECLRFWKVKRVQIAKVILDCLDNKITFTTCCREVERIFSNGLCYASLRENYPDKIYTICLLVKVIYVLSILDYDV